MIRHITNQKYNAAYSQNHKGFTLLEVLLVLLIFSLIVSAADTFLSRILAADETLQENSQSLSELQKTFIFMQRDIRQMVPRLIRDEYDDENAEIMVGEEGNLLEFTHMGWRNPLARSRGNFQRVAYRLNEDKFERLYWKVLDRAQDSEPVKLTLMNGINHIEFEFLDMEHQWQQSWDIEQIKEEIKNRKSNSAGSQDDPNSNTQSQADNLLPLAIKVHLEHARYGEIERTFAIDF